MAALKLWLAGMRLTILPYSLLLSKTFNTHMNVEFCNSVKSFKYVYKLKEEGSGLYASSVTDRKESPVTEHVESVSSAVSMSSS